MHLLRLSEPAVVPASHDWDLKANKTAHCSDPEGAPWRSGVMGRDAEVGGPSPPAPSRRLLRGDGSAPGLRTTELLGEGAPAGGGLEPQLVTSSRNIGNSGRPEDVCD